MADLVRAIESDLFGSYEWSAELYEDLADVPEAIDRAFVCAGLLRAYEALGRGDDALTAAERMVAAQEEVPGEAGPLLDALEAPREALFATSSPEAAQAFVEAFDPLWAQGPRAFLVPDAIVACLARSNVLAPRLKRPKTDAAGAVALGGPSGDHELHRWAAATWEELTRLLQPRISAGGTVWQETAAATVHRAVVAWRLAGDETRARGAAARAPPVDLGRGG